MERECVVVRRGDRLIFRREMLNAVAYAFVLSIAVVWAGYVLVELLNRIKMCALVERRAELRRSFYLDFL